MIFESIKMVKISKYETGVEGFIRGFNRFMSPKITRVNEFRPRLDTESRKKSAFITRRFERRPKRTKIKV